MNKHLETLVEFGRGTKKIYKDAFYDLWDALDELVSAFKKIGMVIFTLIIWVLAAIVMILALPLAIWYRLKCEKDYEIAVTKAMKDAMDRMSPVKRGGEDE